MRSIRTALIALVVLACAAPAARAEPCVDSERVAQARRILEGEARRADRWNLGWVAFFVTSGVASTAAASLVDSEGRRDSFYASGAKSAIAALAAAIRPLSIPTLGPCATEAEAEAALLAAATVERRGRRWVKHAEGILLNLATFAVLGARGHWRDGVINTATGIAVHELRIFTQPMGATEVRFAPVVGADGGVAIGLSFEF